MKLYMSLYQKNLKTGDQFSVGFSQTAVWVQSGSVFYSGQRWEAGDGFYLPPQGHVTAENACELLCYCVEPTDEHLPDIKPKLTADFDWVEGDYILRLDSVTFPNGAIAYRHVHAGAGIRSLVRGVLEIQSDHHREQMEIGDAWFEAAKSPVRATGAATEVSQFVRALVLPVKYAGKPTITLLNPEDFDKPKLQTNQRFFDQLIRG